MHIIQEEDIYILQSKIGNHIKFITQDEWIKMYDIFYSENFHQICTSMNYDVILTRVLCVKIVDPTDYCNHIDEDTFEDRIGITLAETYINGNCKITCDDISYVRALIWYALYKKIYLEDTFINNCVSSYINCIMQLLKDEKYNCYDLEIPNNCHIYKECDDHEDCESCDQYRK